MRLTGVNSGLAVVMLTVLMAGCAPPPDVRLGDGGTPGATAPASDPGSASSPADTAWRHLATTEGRLDGGVAGVAVEDAAGLAQAWTAYGLPQSAPEVDFDRSVVLLLGQPDDACVDELVGLDVVGGGLQLKWLAPPGVCAQPLLTRIHAVEVDRRHVPSTFEVAFPEPFADQAEAVTLRVATVDGDPPPPPQPPAAMTDAQMDEVFADHEVRRCTPQDSEIPSATPGAPSGRDGKAAGLEEVRAWLADRGYRADHDYVPFVARGEGGSQPGLWVDGGAADRVRAELDTAFGEKAVLVVDHPYDFKAVDKAQRDLGALMNTEGPGAISFTTGLPGPVTIGMIDPTREALDAVAAAVDASVVCVEPALSGVSDGVGQP